MNKLELLRLNNKEENIIYSPYSLLIALSMLYEGADGNTKEELNKIISDEQIYNINNIDSVLSVLNKMYIKNNINSIINANYKRSIKEKYNSDIELNELNDVSIINKYIEDNTFGQIKDMLDEIRGNLLLINTLAVDMEWPYKIYGNNVNAGLFNNVEASYVYGFKKHNASYYKDEDVTVLGLDLKQYDNNIYETVIIQPDNFSLSEYINNINDDKLNNILNNLKSLRDDPRKVEIAVPKFSFEYNFNTLDTFSRLGLDLINPNLSRISDLNDGINIFHKVNIDFSEAGLKAAAATVIELMVGSARITESEILHITIDKPFLFLLREKTSNTILFMGTVYNPILWEDDENNYTYEY